jgi:hypothetical protein
LHYVAKNLKPCFYHANEDIMVTFTHPSPKSSGSQRGACRGLNIWVDIRGLNTIWENIHGLNIIWEYIHGLNIWADIIHGLNIWTNIKLFMVSIWADIHGLNMGRYSCKTVSG